MSRKITLSRISLAAFFILLATVGMFWLVKSGSRPATTQSASAGDPPASTDGNAGVDGGYTPPAPDATVSQPNAGDAISAVDPSGNPAPQPLVPVANGGGGNREVSIRALAAKGKTVVDILKDADMSDPEVRARKVAEMRLLEESQKNAVIAKARELGIPLRKEGPGHKVAILYDIRDGRPLYRTTLNTNAAISTGANLLDPAPYSLNGSGVKVGVWDGGSVRNTHQELSGRVTRKNSSASVDDHATHVAGTIGATGVQPAAKGMAPLATIDSYDWNSDYSEMTAAGTATAGDTTKLPLSNHSYGYEIIAPDVPEDFMGRYETEAAATDAVAAVLPYYLPFWAAGNEQDLYTSLNGYQSITFNGLAKNIMTVGAADDAVTSGTRDPAKAVIASFSSLGPCDDGRIKPDVVANGVDLYSSVGTSNAAYDGTYSGTSMATPNAMGSAVLLEQLYAREFSGQRMRASLLKALIIHTASDRGNPGPDYTYGWGLMNVKAAADVILAHKASLAAPKLIESSITNAASPKTHTFTWDGVSPIRATLCWTDPAGTAQTGSDSRTPNLKHNLDAKITAPDTTTTYSPYVMPFVATPTLAAMSQNATTGKNNVDNVEQVYLAAPTQAGTYTMTVSLDGSLITASQAYSLVITGGVLVESNPPPSLALTSPADGSAYLPGAEVTVSATAIDLTTGGAPGAVTQVEFFAGTTSLGVDTTAPYSVSWTPATGGSYAITAKATDNEAAVATSTASTITILTGDGSPVVSSFTPSSGAGSALVILSGSNFAGISSVKFNGTDAAFTVDSAGQITATVPALATTGTITVTNLYGTGTSSTPFTVIPLPVLISQIYGASASTGSTYKQDYVELYNRSTSAVSVAGWTVQYAASTGTTWSKVTLTGSIPAGKHYLVGLATGTIGSALPTPDVTTNAFNISGTSGKIALMNSTTTLTGSSPIGNAALQDFVGYGAANAYETAAAPSQSNTTAIFRAGSGATDTGNNSADFSTAAPNPRNTASGVLPAPVISSALTATGTVGTAFTYQITASNTPTSFNATGLPAGLVVNTTTGAITGTPTTAGSSTVTISATNITGTGTASLAITINPGSGGGNQTNILSEDFVTLTTGSNSTTSGPSSTQWTGNVNFPIVSSGYSAGGMIKLGTGSSAGSITSKTIDLSPNGGNFFVSFKVKGWTSLEGAIKVTVTGLASQTVAYTSLIASPLETKVLTFTGGTAGSTIKFETTAKRAFLDDILVYYTTPPAGATFADWIGGYSVGGMTALNDDFDRDGIANGLENILGTAPEVSTAGLTQVSTTATTLVFRHSRSNSVATDLTASYEWSSNLVNWRSSGAADGGTTVTIAAATITDTSAPNNDLVEVTATVTGTPEPQIFVRLKAVKP